MGDAIANTVKNAAKEQNSVLGASVGTAFKVLNAPTKVNQVKNNAQKIVSDSVNAIQNNQYHQKLSSEADNETEKNENNKTWKKYVPVAAGALLLSAAIPRIIETKDITQPIKDVRDGIKRGPAAILNKVQKKDKIVEGARKGAAAAVKKSGGVKKDINNSLLSNFGAGLFKGTGELTAFLAGSAYLKHRADREKNKKAKEDMIALNNAYDRVHPVGNAGKKIYGIMHKSAFEDLDGLYKQAFTDEQLKAYVDKKSDQFFENARNRSRAYDINTNKQINRVKSRGMSDENAQKIIQSLKLDKQSNRAFEYEKAKAAKRMAEARVEKYKQHRLAHAEKLKKAARDDAHKKLFSGVKYDIIELGKNVGNKAKSYFTDSKKRKKLLTAAGIATAGAAINQLHKRFIKPKLKNAVKNGIKGHYDKKIDNLYEQQKSQQSNNESEKQAAFFGDGVDRAILNAAEMPMELAWTAGSEILKQRARLKKAQERIKSRNNHRNKKGVDSNGRRHNGNNFSSRS